MLFYYVRHGDPIYSPDSLTELGHRQAEALSKRFAVLGLDKIYASSSNRAIQTAAPTCQALDKQAEILDWCNESYAWKELTLVSAEGKRCWTFQDRKTCELFSKPSVRALGDRWYDHPELKEYNFGVGVARILDKSDEFFASLGYIHDRENNCYIAEEPSRDRVALFAHQGFGLAFLSCLLDIPFPDFVTRFDIQHTGVTVIKFSEQKGICIPKVLQLSNDSHLYKEGTGTKYHNTIEL